MKAGRRYLNRIFHYAKFIAVAAVIFLLAASVDNVPDCPELMNSGSGASLALQSVHHDTAALPQAVRVTWARLQPPVLADSSSCGKPIVTSPSSVPRCRYRATDPSPPSA